jgi:RND family efflux transporter MFP subunit
MSRGSVCLILATAAVCAGQKPDLVRPVPKALDRTVVLSGEFLPYQAVDLHARVNGFVETVAVDRGSTVKQGEPLVKLAAPEMEAQAAEARAKVHAAESHLAEAKAKLASALSTYERMKKASETPGAIAGNELVVAQQSVEAAQGVVSSAEATRAASRASLDAVEKLQGYLTIRAPFAGVITERLVHPGALAGPNTGPLLRLEQVSRLRLVVAVPEANYAGVARGRRAPFRVAAYPDRQFAGTVARSARAIDPKTRTMSVELDVDNAGGMLAPGMYPEVTWPVRGGASAMVVPVTSVVATTERTFVIRMKNGRAEWVDVRRGAREGDQVEVYGDLNAGDLILRRASDEVREGSELKGGGL